MTETQHKTQGGLVLAGILAMGFLLRIWGVSFGLPYLYHADEPIVVNHALAYGGGDLNPHFFKIPPLVSYLVFLLYGLSYVGGRMGGVFKGIEDFEDVFLRDPTFFYLSARIVFGVLVGTLSIYILFLLVRRFFSERSALATAFLFAVAFVHVRDSHYVYADIPLVLVLILAFFPILEIAQGKAGLRDPLWAGMLLGLAAGVKYNGVALAIPYLGATLIAPSKQSRVMRWIVAAVAAGVISTVVNPFGWLDFTTFRGEIALQAQATGFTGILHHLKYSLNGGIGLPLVIAGIFGLFLGLIQREPKRVVIGSFVMGYYLLLVLRGQPYDRYVLPIIPFILFFAADALGQATDRWVPKRQGFFLGGLIVLFALPPLAKSVLSDILFSAKDVRTVAKQWVEGELAPGTRLALDRAFFMPRLGFSETQLLQKLEAGRLHPHFPRLQERRIQEQLDRARKSRKGYELYFLSNESQNPSFLFNQPTIPFDLARLKEERVEYVLMTRVEKEPNPSDFYQRLRTEARLVKRFSPYRNPQIEFPYDPRPLTGGPFLWMELIERERNGQPIEIYQL